VRSLLSNRLLFNSKLGGLAASFFQTTLCKQQSGLLRPFDNELRKQLDHVSVAVVRVALVLSWPCQNLFHRLLIDFLESVVESASFFGVFGEVVEVRVGLLVDVGVAEEVQQVAQLALDELRLLGRVAVCAGVELARGGLELIGLRGGASCLNHLLDAALDVGAINVLDFEQVLEDPFVGILGVVHKVLVAHDVDWVQLFKNVQY